MQGHVAHCVSQVPTNLSNFISEFGSSANLCSNSLALSGDDVHLELLPGVVLRPTEHDEGEGVALPSDCLPDVLRPDRVLARPGPHQDKAVFVHLGFDILPLKR